MVEVTKNLKDAAYVVIGLGVIGYQRAEAQAEELRKRVADQRNSLEQQVDEVRAQINKLANDVEDRLPERAKELVTQARTRLNGAAA